MEIVSVDSTRSLRNLYFVRTAFQVVWAAIYGIKSGFANLFQSKEQKAAAQRSKQVTVKGEHAKLVSAARRGNVD